MTGFDLRSSSRSTYCKTVFILRLLDILNDRISVIVGIEIERFFFYKGCEKLSCFKVYSNIFEDMLSIKISQ